MYFIDLGGIPIFEQLKIEEALLRTNDQEWCLINRGAPVAIVMGMSGIIEELINLEQLNRKPIPLIKRYSGGGTVVVDPSTFFVTFICNSDSQQIAPFPKAVMEWSFNIYHPFFHPSNFQLRENDYVIGERKCGGNAQYIQKKRWVHHTSFLWDYAPSNMDYLLLPSKRPIYRQDRCHTDFLCCLKEFYLNEENLFSDLKKYLLTIFPEEVAPTDLFAYLDRPHRKSTQIINTFLN